MAERDDDPALNQWKPRHLQKIEAEVKDTGDPAPTAEAIALDRMNSLVNNVTSSTLNELRDLRDQIDNLMRVIQARNSTIQNAFAQHVAFATETITCKTIIKETLAKINNDFSNGMAPIAKNITVEVAKQ